MAMPSLVQRLSAPLTGLMLLVAALTAGALSTTKVTSESVDLASCIGYCAYPRNAGKIFRWGREAWKYEFEAPPFPRDWQSNHPKLIGQQQGMLTIKARSGTHRTVAWPRGRAARYGRWESRLRAVELGSAGRHFRFTWRLVAVGGTHCGGNLITLATYRPGDRRVRGAVRTLPDHEFRYSLRRDLRSRAWHAYAVEVTRDHISWFVDTKVVHTERRPAALSGVKLKPEFVISGSSKHAHRSSMMQMDWVRHYSLQRPNARSIKAPRMERRTYPDTC
jgi:hypothetical protein